MPGLDHGARIGDGAGDRVDHAAETGRARHGDGQFVTGKMRRQHHQHAQKTDGDRRPAIDAHPLLEHQSGERHADQRRRKADGVGLDQRQPRQRAEIAEHADNAECAAAGLAERTFGAHGRCQFAAPGIDDHAPARWRRPSGRTPPRRSDIWRRDSGSTPTSGRTAPPRRASARCLCWCSWIFPPLKGEEMLRLLPHRMSRRPTSSSAAGMAPASAAAKQCRRPSPRGLLC